MKKNVLLILSFVLSGLVFAFPVSEKKDKILEIYPHQQELCFPDFGEKPSVYKDMNSSEILYVIQDNDVLNVDAVIYNSQSMCTFVRVKIPSGETGYMQLSSNPYKNGNFSPAGIEKDSSFQNKVLKFEDYLKFGDYSDGMPVKLHPFAISETVCILDGYKTYKYKVDLITEDFKWVRIKSDTLNGWIETKRINRDIGGPVLYTPEVCIQEEFIDQYCR